MRQLEIRAAEKPGLSALKADADACGELKDVASVVFPDVAMRDPEKARNDLSDALRPSHPRKLDIDEAIEIVVEAVIKQQRSSLLEHIISRLPKDSCEFRWLTKQEKIERVTTTLSEMLPQFVDVLQRAQALVNADRK
jgi:hypothetical protein